MDDDLIAKLLAVAILGFGTMSVGLLPPVLVIRCRRPGVLGPSWRAFLSCLLCLGSGLLFSTALVHMTREARPMLMPLEKVFPATAEALVGFGFLFVYLMEEVVHLVFHESPRLVCRHRTTTSRRSHSLPDAVVFGSDPEQGVTSTRLSDGPPCYGSLDACPPPTESRPLIKERLYRRSTADGVDERRDLAMRQSSLPTSISSPIAPEDDYEIIDVASPFPSFVLLLALSIHSSIEGLSIGLGTSAEDVFFLLIIVSVHKFAIAFCLGAETILFGEESHLSPRTNSLGKSAAYLAVFALSSVAGILGGSMVGHAGMAVEKSEMVGAILQAVSSGALIYVALIEILPRERTTCHNIGIRQFTAVLLGFTVPLILDYFMTK